MEWSKSCRNTGLLRQLVEEIVGGRQPLDEVWQTLGEGIRRQVTVSDIAWLDQYIRQNLGTGVLTLEMAHILAALNDRMARRIGGREMQGHVGLLRANLALQAGRAEEAITCYERALRIFDGLDQQLLRAAILCDMTQACRQLGRWADACTHGQQALSLAQSHNDMTIQILSLENLGASAFAQGKMGRAIMYYQEALKLARHLNDTEATSSIQGNMGLVYRRRGDPTRAIACYQETLAHKCHQGDKRGQSIWRGNLALAYRDLGRLDEALGQTQRAWALSREVGDRQGMAINWSTQGVIYTERGEPQQAIVAYQKALDLYRKMGDLPDECNVLISLGLAYRLLRHLDPARACFEKALKIGQEIDDQRVKSTAKGNLGLLDWEEGKSEQAIKTLREAIELGQSLDVPSSALYWSNLGLAYLDTGQQGEAQNAFRQAIDLTRQIGDVRGEARCLGNLGNVLYAQGRLNGARTMLEGALRKAKLGGDWEDLWRLHRLMGDIAGYGFQEWETALGEFEEAIDLLEESRAHLSLDIFRRQLMQDKVAVYQGAALAAWRLGRFELALERAEQAKTRYLADVLTRRDQQPRGTKPELSASYQQALKEVQRKRSAYLAHDLTNQPVPLDRPEDYPQPDSNSALKGESLRCQQEDRLDRSQAAQQALVKAENHLAEIIEQIREHDPDFQSIYSAPSLTFAQIRDLIPDSEPKCALVEFMVTPQGTAIFVVTAGQERLSSDDVFWVKGLKRDDLQSLLVVHDEQGQESGGWVKDYEQDRAGRWLSTLEKVTGNLWPCLFAQVHKRLQSLCVRRLILIPHQGLHVLPLHALHRQENGQRRYLLDDYEISYAPSAAILALCQARATEPQRQDAHLLAVANPTADPRLAFAPMEVAAVAAHFSEPVILASPPRRQDEPPTYPVATREAFLHYASRANVLHFAGHGKYIWGAPLDSALILCGQYDYDEQGVLKVKDVKKARLTLAEMQQDLALRCNRLTVLSACETGLTDPHDPADEYVGLPAGLLMAGTSAVVASLWAVPDVSTELLMKRFYAHLCGDLQPTTTEPLPPATALHRAQIWLRDEVTAKMAAEVCDRRVKELTQDDAAYRVAIEELMRYEGRCPEDHPFAHPLYWAPFTLDGDLSALHRCQLRVCRHPDENKGV
jgi:CHAT domain-containing protein/Tfp pilus assembly protein PilF